MDRLLGLGSASGAAGRVVLSREDKEAAKLGLSVFTHHRVDSGGSGASPAAARKKPRAEDKAEPDVESHKKGRKEKKRKKKKHKKHKKKKDKEHKREADTPSPSPSPSRSQRKWHGSDSSSPGCKRRKCGHGGHRSPSSGRQDGD